ncbi:54S ribosomal protein L35, mitochondrial [Pseudozyma hubeiensis]|nr:54S ribosomal protein L35, mitochondrial [Pseudozyma hubeiensis]
MATPASRSACRSLLRSQRRSIANSARNSAASSSSSSSSSSEQNASSSSSSTSTWQPRLEPGTLPAYDEALKFLSSHSASLRAQIADLKTTHPNLTEPELSSLTSSLTIASLVNDPSTLASFASSSPTHYDASNPAFVHLRERLWRRDSGVLAKLMQRCTLMSVFPDVLPGMTPTADVSIAFGEGKGYTDSEKDGGDVLAGVMMEASETVEVPQVNVNVFHADVKKYTLVMVDPDQPDVESQSFKTSLLALKEDIPLSTTTNPTIDLTSAMSLPYIPPHPQNGTPYHRYTTILFEQPSSSSSPSADAVQETQRHNFDLTSFVQQRGLIPAGIHFWRSKWSPESAESITKVHKEVLKVDEPKYTMPPRADKVRKQVGEIGSKWFS